MIRHFAFLSALVLALGALRAVGADTAVSPKPQGAEVTFVNSITQDLNARFPTPADAVKAGYFRYTNEDKTGAISYANEQWVSSDPQHPSQLWYSVSGKLLGADYSVPQSSSPNKPQLWGVNPARWTEFHAHIHYIYTDAQGKEAYGGARMKDFVAAGGDPNNPSAATLVKMGKIKDAASVKKIFQFPHIWDLEVWVTPNPSGAFAEANPLIKPSATAQSMD